MNNTIKVKVLSNTCQVGENGKTNHVSMLTPQIKRYIKLIYNRIMFPT